MPDRLPLPTKSRSRWQLAVAVIFILATLIAGWLTIQWKPHAVDLPAVDLTDVDPAVAKAIREAADKVSTMPASAEAWGTLGMILHNHIFAEPALACYAQAEKLDAEDGRWPYFQGLIVLSYDPPAALPKLARATRLASGAAERAHLRLAELQSQLGRWDEARREFDAVLKSSPRHPRASLGLARVHLQGGDLRASRDLLPAALAHPFTRRSALRLSAEIFQRQGDARSAQRELAQALAMPDEPEWPDEILAETERHAVGEAARIKRASRRLDQNHPSEAIELLQSIVGDYPQSEKALTLLGFSQMQLRQWPNAEAALTAALKLNAHSARALLYLGVVKAQQRDWPAAIEWFKKALAEKPDSLEAHFNLGLCLKENGERTAALQAFRDALRCQPLSAPAHAELGALLLQNNQSQAAVLHLQQAVELNPNDSASAKLLEAARNTAGTKSKGNDGKQ